MSNLADIFKLKATSDQAIDSFKVICDDPDKSLRLAKSHKEQTRQLIAAIDPLNAETRTLVTKFLLHADVLSELADTPQARGDLREIISCRSKATRDDLARRFIADENSKDPQDFVNLIKTMTMA